MGGVPDDGAVLGTDGRFYYTVPEAARRLAVSSDTVRREFSLVLARNLVQLPSGKGRPHTHVVLSDDVDERRRLLLERLGVEAGPASPAVNAELRTLRQRVRELAGSLDELQEQYELLCDTSTAQGRELETLRRYHLDHVRSLTAGGAE